MSQPFIGEIRMFAGNFPPAGWAFCDGQLIAISENDALFTLIGTIYGGDGEETFALPDLRARIPIHQFQGSGLSARIIGETGGTEQETLTIQQIPNHSHAFLASTDPGVAITPSGGLLGAGASINIFRPTPPAATPMDAASVTPAGGSQPHDNMHPFICINYIISLFGLFPQFN
jgi:microcystin-dependent protein